MESEQLEKANGEACEVDGSQDKCKDFRSKKFIAYLFSIIISLGVFIVVFSMSKDVSTFQKFLDFMLYSLVAFMGGNSLEHISKKIGK